MEKHPIVHIEISANNLVEASYFYRELFSWEVEQIPAMNYATFTAEGGPGGGFNPVVPANPPGTVVVYIQTDDIEGDLAKAVKLGGKILSKKMEIPGEGWFGLFADPTGNKMGLYTPLKK